MRQSAIASIVLTLLLVAPTIQAHASPDPLEVEEHLIDDDVDDSYGQYDGFDIQDVYVREASLDDLGDGLVFRIYLYGGFAEPAVASSLPLELDVTAAGSVHTLAVDTSDGTSWTGTSIVEQEMEDENGQTQGYLQLFASYSALSVEVGDAVGPFAVRTYADDDLRDIAPGGRPVPGTLGHVIVPGDGVTVKDSITLEGAVGYTQSTLTTDNGQVRVSVQNQIAVTGQHISLHVDDPAGWTIDPETFSPAVVEPGQHPIFTFQATAEPDSADATITVRTDLGGLETFSLAAGDIPPPSSQGGPEPNGPGDDPDNKDTPMALWPFILALVGVAVMRRRG